MLQCADRRQLCLRGHRFSPRACLRLLPGGMVPYVGHARLQLDHPALADPCTRHVDILLLCLSCCRQCHPAVRYFHRLHRLLFTVGIHAVDHDRAACIHDAAGLSSCASSERTHADPAARNRLDRLRTLERLHAMLHVCLCLRKLL